MTPEEKKPFEQQQEVDQKRYEKECNDLKENGFFINAEGVNSKDMTPKKPKGKNSIAPGEPGPLMPKKVGTPYIIFLTEWYQKNKTTGSGESVTAAARAKIIAEEWSKLGAAEKQKYIDLSEEDRQRYDVQMEEIKLKGFFMCDDGSKSSDHKAKPKKVKRQ